MLYLIPKVSRGNNKTAVSQLLETYFTRFVRVSLAPKMERGRWGVVKYYSLHRFACVGCSNLCKSENV